MMRRRATAAALALGLAGLVPAAAEAAPAQGTATRNRVRDIIPRVRDIEARWRALDNSERVEETKERTVVTFSADVLFEFDRADLTPAAGSRLDQLVAELQRLGARTVTIAGHTDSQGDPPYNNDLSLRRARAVEGALATRLSGGFRFEVSGKGEDEPVAPNEVDGADNSAGRALNRRVVITYPNR
jgi:outer membrane protein OmpA-like peptidoglycan-associated protein